MLRRTGSERAVCQVWEWSGRGRVDSIHVKRYVFFCARWRFLLLRKIHVCLFYF